MSQPGYLYVLANSSMPDLVKVGKTTRHPSQRAEELSGVSGVPTPFIVVYEQFFNDCDAAESFVHALLSQRGFRISEGREFFSARASEVVNAIIQVPGAEVPEQLRDELLAINANQNDDLEDMELNAGEPVEPWRDIFEEAQHYHYGQGDYIEDSVEALRLYHEAAKLGCLRAYENIGDIYQYGRDSTPKDEPKALEYYKAGARKGNYMCYLLLARAFLVRHDEENSRKCIKCFVSCIQKVGNIRAEELRPYGAQCYFYIWQCIAWKTRPMEDILPFLRLVKHEMLIVGEALLKNYLENREYTKGYNDSVAWEKAAVDWIKTIPEI